MREWIIVGWLIAIYPRQAIVVYILWNGKVLCSRVILLLLQCLHISLNLQREAQITLIQSSILYLPPIASPNQNSRTHPINIPKHRAKAKLQEASS